MENNYGPPAATVFPWENEQLSFADRVLETVKGVLLTPQHVFARLTATQGIGKALLFAVIFGTIGNIFQYIYQFAFQSLSLIPQLLQGRHGGGEAVFGMIAMPVFMGIMIVLSPLFVIIGVFIAAGIYHLLLMLLRGATAGFETTIRVVAYTMGASMLLYVVPLCGAVIGSIWALVVYIIGLKTAHQTETYKAVLAVLLPVILCCCCIAIFIFAIIGSIGAAGFMAGMQGGNLSPEAY